MKRSVLLAMILGALTAAPSASALIEPGDIGALPANPYSAQPGVTVNGTLFTNQPLGPGGTPQDYLKFTVASAGETIEFTDQNTTKGINPNTCDQFCPVYLSLVDSNFTGLGDGSGTIATYGDTEVFDWTFQSPGTYYMVMESDGDVNLSYAASYRTGSGTCTHHCSTGSPPVSPPLVRVVRVVPNQRGTTVKATLTLGQWAKSTRVSLLLHGRMIVAIRRSPLSPGRHTWALALPARDKRMLAARHKLSLVVRMTVHGKSGLAETFNRRVTLSH
jgi:hypothetical protein